MSALEEHKPVEKRRALGRGLDSLLPSGPRLATTAVPSPAVIPPAPIVIPTAPSGAASPVSAEPSAPVSEEIAEIHAGREKRPHFSQNQGEMGHPAEHLPV